MERPTGRINPVGAYPLGTGFIRKRSCHPLLSGGLNLHDYFQTMVQDPGDIDTGGFHVTILYIICTRRSPLSGSCGRRSDVLMRAREEVVANQGHRRGSSLVAVVVLTAVTRGKLKVSQSRRTSTWRPH